MAAHSMLEYLVSVFMITLKLIYPHMYRITTIICIIGKCSYSEGSNALSNHIHFSSNQFSNHYSSFPHTNQCNIRINPSIQQITRSAFIYPVNNSLVQCTLKLTHVYELQHMHAWMYNYMVTAYHGYRPMK